ncbi:MAG: GTPase Era [Clostridia bacterium]|nr:GTPase Era [Clostridia bacterium]
MSGYRSGFAAIIGCPNVGKSTLLNRLIGQKVAIVTDRAQTTRNRITGVLTREGYQIVFLDTPGVTEPKNRLGEYMRQTAFDATNEVEAILFVTDALAGLGRRDEALMQRLNRAAPPVFALINKCDAAAEARIAAMETRLRDSRQFEEVLRVSAKTGENLDRLETLLCGCLTEGPQYFPEDMVTDQPERVICAELIREKALSLLREEVPHGIGVSIDKLSLREDRALYDLYATIYCERDSHKAIIIGKGGRTLKAVGTQARKDIEWLLGQPVNLQLWVKVSEDWRNRESVLRELGYT